jgi:transcriptional regulator with GAF, ATPase, and Fis domain
MSGGHTAPGLERAHGAALALLIAEAGRTFAASPDLDGTIHSIGDLVVGWFADWCIVALRFGNGPFERVYVAAADDRDAKTAELLQHFILATRRRTLITDVLRAPEPVLVPSVAAAHRAGVARNGEHDLMRRLALTSFLVVPLVAGNRRVGALLIASRSGELTRAELRVSQEIAAIAATAIDNAGR